MFRENTRPVTVGDCVIGGGHPIVVQSMTNTKTEDAEASLSQIRELAAAGCGIVRLAVPTMEAAQAFGRIKKESPLPLVADIHFDHRLAIAAMENGADAIRINPGNIGGEEKLRAVVDVAKAHQIPIRVGVNAGSLEKDLLEKYGKLCADALVESALTKIDMIREMGHDMLVASIKASDVPLSIAAHRKMAEQSDVPLHIGITEAGTVFSGTIKSAVGLGVILSDGIGDTIRVSLTGDPCDEVRVAKQILQSLKLSRGQIEVVSCPTCGRTQIDLIPLANAVEARLRDIPLDLKVAVMGCVVNGPGEAREADLAICGGRGEGLLMKNGEILRKVPEEGLLDALVAEVMHIAAGAAGK